MNTGRAGTLACRLTGKRALVTGGEGFVGRRVVALGEELGVRVVSPRVTEGVTRTAAHPFDIRERGRVIAEVRAANPDFIVHLAAAGVAHGSGNPLELFDVNVAGAVNILEAAASLEQTPTVIMAGSGFEYGRRTSPVKESDALRPADAYAATKVAAFMAAEMYVGRVAVTVLRPFSIYGPGERSPRILPYVIDQVVRREPVLLTACEQVRDYAFVDDVAEAFWRAATLPGTSTKVRVLNLGTGRRETLRTFLELAVRGLVGRGFTPNLVFGARAYREGEPDTYVPEIDEMRRTLGWMPEVSLEAGIERTLEATLGTT